MITRRILNSEYNSLATHTYPHTLTHIHHSLTGWTQVGKEGGGGFKHYPIPGESLPWLTKKA